VTRSGPEARELALEALYQADQRGLLPEDAVAGLPARAARMVRGVLEQRAELDQAIDRASSGWRVERMPVVDRAVLRLALYELRNQPSTPTAVVINEAVELAKTYSTERSGRFVNGVLSRLALEERAEDAVSDPPETA
jgi:transcription antitermination protein NusB